MANAREEKVWDIHAKKLANDFDKEVEDHINVPLIQYWANSCSQKNAKVLDFGCGVGLWKYIFDSLDYTGCDQNKQMIETAKNKYPDSKFILHEWSNLPFEDNHFDIIFTRAVLMHNSNKDKISVMSELARVIKTGGYFIASEATYNKEVFKNRFPNKEWNDYFTDGFSFTKKGWFKEFNKYGFRLAEFEKPKNYKFIKIEKD